jgi:hypothetical protein
MARKGLKFAIRASDVKTRPPMPRRAPLSGVGRLRKIACLGGAKTLQLAPWHDETWELWSHASCRHMGSRDPDLLFDLHPPELWRDPTKKTWDPKYATWLTTNRIPIMMQKVYADVPASIKYPFATMITEFPRGYMTNHLAYMVALALMEGVTHLAVYGCDYGTNSEYGPQRGSAEYWLGVAEGRGVRVLLPPGCDLLNKPALLYGYESHPNGVRDPSYSFAIGPLTVGAKAPTADDLHLTPISDPACPKLRDIGVPPDPTAFERAFPAEAVPA